MAECYEQTVAYTAGAIRQWSQELVAGQTYTWSTLGLTSEVGPCCPCLAHCFCRSQSQDQVGHGSGRMSHDGGRRLWPATRTKQLHRVTQIETGLLDVVA